MNKIKVIIKRPDETFGHMTWISDTLENIQRTVDGYFEVVTLQRNPKVLMLVNEDGKINGLPYNFKMPLDFIVGTVIVCGAKGDELSDVPIDMSLWKRMLIQWGN